MTEFTWAQVAWQCYIFAVSQGAKNVKPDDFNPLRKSRQMSVARLHDWVREQRKKLPKTLTEDEIKERWEEFKRCQQQVR